MDSGRRLTDNTFWTAKEKQTNSATEWQDGKMKHTRRAVAMVMPS